VPFCPKCGKEVPYGAIYCPYCGSQVRRGVEQDWKAGTGLDLLMADSRVQRNWMLRVVAYLIDSVIIGVATAIIGFLLTFPLIIEALLRGGWGTWRGFFGLPFSLGVVQVLYFTLVEGRYGASIGKRVMGLKVIDADGGPPSFTEALIRNVSKVYWALLLLDVFIGLLSRFDPRQKYTDQIAGTKVVSLGAARFSRSAVRPMPAEERKSSRPRKRGDPLGGVNVGVILIIIAVFFILHRGIFSGIVTWLEGLGEAGPTMIPGPLIHPLVWFLSAMGVWSLVLAIIRFASGINRGNGISDAFSGAFLLTAAFLFRRYASGLMGLNVLLPALVIALGAAVLLASATFYLLYDRLQPKA